MPFLLLSTALPSDSWQYSDQSLRKSYSGRFLRERLISASYLRLHLVLTATFEVPRSGRELGVYHH